MKRLATTGTTSVRDSLRALPSVLVIGGLIAAAACGSSTTTNVTAPASNSRCQASVQGTPTSFGPSGGTGTISVGVARECAWSASSTVPWIELTSAREGQGEARISYRVAANAEPVTRSGRISVAEQRVDVSQQAAPCTYSVSRPAESIGPEGGQLPVNVATHSACSWTAATDASWITIAPSSGSGAATVQLTFAPNPDGDRTAAVVVAGQSLLFTQTTRPPEPPAPNPPPPPGPPQPPVPPQCTFDVSPQHRDFTALGGPGSFTLTAGAGCAWTAAPSDAWVTIASQPSGSGSTELRYLVQPNASSVSREATIVIGTAAHRVRQDGVKGGDDDKDRDVRIRGVVSSLSGQCPALQFVVTGTTVTTTNQTDFKRGNCSHMANGLEVEVQGTRQSNGQVRARSVTLFRE